MSRVRSALEQNLNVETFHFQARKFEQQRLHNNILKEKFTKLLNDVKQMCELSPDYTIQLDPCFYLCPKKSSKDWEEFTTTLYKDCKDAGIFMKSNLDNSNPIEISNRVASSKKFLLITDQDYKQDYESNNKFSAGVDAAILNGLNKNNFRIIPINEVSEALIPSELRNYANTIDIKNQSYYYFLKNILQFIYNIPNQNKEFEDLWDTFAIQNQTAIQPLQKDQVIQLLQQEHEADLLEREKYKAMWDKAFEHVFSPKVGKNTKLDINNLASIAKDEMVGPQEIKQENAKPDSGQIEDRFKNFPDKIIIESLTEVDNCKSRLNFERRENIGNAGFDRFLEKMICVDPAGDFTNLLQIDCIYPDDRLPFYKLRLCSNMLLPSGETTDVCLSANDILNLAGDIFTSLKKPISSTNNEAEQKSRFIEAYNALIDPNNYNKIMASLEGLNNYDNEISRSPALTFEKKVDANSNSLNYDVMKNDNNYPTHEFCNNHLSITTESLDHFGASSYAAFSVGLSLACEKAVAAANLRGDNKNALITEALCYVLFACHFLVDIYTKGHIDLPMREMLNAVTGNKINAIPMVENLSSTKKMMILLLLKQMHDGDHEEPVRLRKLNQTKSAPPDPKRWENLPKFNEEEGCDEIQASNYTQPELSVVSDENVSDSIGNHGDQYDFEHDKAYKTVEQNQCHNLNDKGEGCDERYDFNYDQACEAIALALNDIYLVYNDPNLLYQNYRKEKEELRKEKTKLLFLDEIKEILIRIEKQKNDLFKHSLFNVKSNNSIEVQTKNGCKRLGGLSNAKNLVSLLSIFYEIKTKNKDTNAKILNKEETESLMKNLDQSNCTFRS